MLYYYVLGSWVLINIHGYYTVLHGSWLAIKSLVSLGQYVVGGSRTTQSTDIPQEDDTCFTIILPGD